MRTRFVALLVAALASVSGIASAEVVQTVAPTRTELPGKVVTLDDVLRSVLARHPLLAAANQETYLAEADMLSAQGGFDPSLRARGSVIPFGPYTNERIDVMAEQPTGLWGTKFVGGWRLGRGAFPVYDGKYETAPYGEARVGVQVPLLRDGPIDRRRAGVWKAEAARKGAAASVAQQKIELVRAATHRYWEWVAAGRRLVIARDLLGVAVTRDAALLARVERGEIAAFERNENVRVMEQRRAAVVAAERSLQNAAIELGMFFRGDDGEPIVLTTASLPGALPEPDGPAPSRAPAEEEAVRRRPELRRLDAAREQANVDRDLARNQRKLGIDVSALGLKDFGPWDPKLTKPELELAVLVDVPLMTRVQDGRVKAAEATLARTTEQARYARDRIRADVRDATNAVDLALERLAAVRAEIEASRSLVAAETQRFELGDGTLLLVNLREQAMFEARQREVDALADYHRAAASRRAAIGEPAGP